jgi:DNA-binding MarR family transcriptional regulator
MEDSVDRHVARWRDLLEITFDDEVEAAATRVMVISKHLKRTSKQAAAQIGLQWFEYETLHALMIREQPGQATPTELADRLLVSPAGITGRLEGMERSGLLRRVRSATDRRRVDVEITAAGRERWQQTMRLRGEAEEAMIGVLSRAEQRTLNRLLRKMLEPIEREGAAGASE